MTPTGRPSAPVVGWIGLGDQGLPMARAIAEAGFPLHAWARRPVSLEALSGVPHVRHGDVKDLAAASDIVALCVGTDDDVLRLAEQVLEGLRPGSVPVNHGTGLPSAATRLTQMCAVPDGIHTTQTMLGDRPALRVEPDHSPRSGTILYFHGGGWMVGSPQTALSMTGTSWPEPGSGRTRWITGFSRAPLPSRG